MSRRLAIAIMGGCLVSNIAWAGPQLEDTVSNCMGINCGAISLRGVHQPNEPFLIQVFAAEGECLRLDVVSQTQDTAMLLVTPSVNFGAVVDDRDFAGGDTRPLIVIDPVPTTGWYTVSVSFFDWGPTLAKFVLKYGRYGTGNPNCPVAQLASAPGLKRFGGEPAKASASSVTDIAIRY
jgi:hypothetical protein